MDVEILARAQQVTQANEHSALSDTKTTTKKQSQRSKVAVPSVKQVDWADIEVNYKRDFIGRGADCDGVFRCSLNVAGYKSDHLAHVVKLFPKSLIYPPLKEGKGLARIHPNIVQASLITSQHPWGLVFPWMNRGTLKDFVQSEGYSGVDKTVRTRFQTQRNLLAKMLISAMSEIHDSGHVHGDLHTANVLVSEDSNGVFTVAISDLSRMVRFDTPRVKESRGSTHHPPEWSRGGGLYTRKADIFALCRILRRHIFNSTFEGLMYKLVRKGSDTNPDRRPTLKALNEAIDHVSRQA